MSGEIIGKASEVANTEEENIHLDGSLSVDDNPNTSLKDFFKEDG